MHEIIFILTLSSQPNISVNNNFCDFLNYLQLFVCFLNITSKEQSSILEAISDTYLNLRYYTFKLFCEAGVLDQWS